MSHEQRMADAGIELPEGYPPAGLYVGAVRVGNHLHIGGHGPVRNDGSMVTGKVGDSVDLQAAQAAAPAAPAVTGASRHMSRTPIYRRFLFCAPTPVSRVLSILYL